MCACLHRNDEIIELLIDRGAGVHFHEKEGTTALVFATERGLQAVVEKLLDAGADVNLRLGDSALAAACRKNNQSLVQLLLLRGAGIDLHSSLDGKTPLLVCCAYNHSK